MRFGRWPSPCYSRCGRHWDCSSLGHPADRADNGFRTVHLLSHSDSRFAIPGPRSPSWRTAHNLSFGLMADSRNRAESNRDSASIAGQLDMIAHIAHFCLDWGSNRSIIALDGRGCPGPSDVKAARHIPAAPSAHRATSRLSPARAGRVAWQSQSASHPRHLSWRVVRRRSR
jgi:hypothetical protein